MPGTKSFKKRIYLDHAASTAVDSRVLKAMLPYFSASFANPGGLHAEALTAKRAVADSRATIARALGAHAGEIIFTASGTEANNLAIVGLARKLEAEGTKPKDIHFITSAIEHPSVLEVFQHLESRGYRVDYIRVDQDGIVDLNQLARRLSLQTALVSIMLANNEIGTIEPIAEVAKIIRRFKKDTGAKIYPLLHTDASQAALLCDINVEKLGIDLLTIDAQKVYGPKGVGALYKKRSVALAPLVIGGTQEHGLRAGTENVPGIVGFAKALELAGKERGKESARLARLCDYGIGEMLAKVPGAELNGSRQSRLPNNINISIPGKNSEFMVLALDARGIAVGTRSACSDPREEGSYVIEALGKADSASRGSLRFSLGRSTKKADIDRLVAALVEIAR